MKKCFREVRQVSKEQVYYRDKYTSLHNKRRANLALLTLKTYAKRKRFEQKNSTRIKFNGLQASKSLVWRSFVKFATKAKAVKGDPIQERLLDSDATVMDVNGDMIVTEER